ncbi:MAG: response regulator [Lachnospiraceae bacterium]|nr:response regulator [Lachnospiraceae bacterium]
MKYNIDFEIIGTLVTLVIAIHFHSNYAVRTKSDRAFLTMIRFILASQILDMVTAYTFSLESPKLALANHLLNTAYSLCSFFSAVSFEQYIASYIFAEKKDKIYLLARRIVIFCYCGLFFANLFIPLTFHFDKATGAYIHDSLYMAGYLVSGGFMMLSLYFILRFRKRFDKKQWYSSITFIFVVFGAMYVQSSIIPDVYLTFGLVSISLLMILFSLETPDYQKLMNTMDELEKAREAANQASQVKSEFLANMSHEIRTPINAMLGFDEMILRESDDKEVLSYAANIKRSGRTLLSLVNDILDLSKIEAGKMEITPAEYDPCILFSEITDMIMPHIQDKRLLLTEDFDPDVPKKLLGDDARLRQVLINLLTNAAKYTAEGSITFSVKVLKKENKKVLLHFSVKDTGIGIRKEDQKNLFSAFERVDLQKNRNIEGTGLGLAITLQILKMMGSNLSLESEYGKGSDFYFDIEQEVLDETPIGKVNILDENRKMRDVSVFREDFTAPTARILVVDDVEMNLKVFKGLLRRSKIRIDTATSGAESIRMLQTWRYDCVFMDHLMPEMDGIQTLELIKKDPSVDSEKIPFIALTANAISGARSMYMQNGFSDYLTKPIDGFTLSDTLKKWLPKEKIKPLPEDVYDMDADTYAPADGHVANRKNSGDTADRDTCDESTFDPDDAILEFAPSSFDLNAESGAEDGRMDPSELMSRLEEAGLSVSSAMGYTGGDSTLYAEILRDYTQAAPGRIAQLSDYYESEKWSDYEIVAHALKSTSRSIGAEGLSDLAKELEFAAKDGDDLRIKENHATFLKQYESLVKTISALLA